MNVYLLTQGDGSDGDEWQVVSIHSTREKAEAAREKWMSTKHYRQDGSTYTNVANEIEEWAVDTEAMPGGGMQKSD